jgi:hypothetical protein
MAEDVGDVGHVRLLATFVFLPWLTVGLSFATYTRGLASPVSTDALAADPTTFIRSAASHVRPDGLIAFHEVAVYGECHALPPVPLWEQCWNWAIIAFRSVMAHPDAAGRMTAYFQDAGLKRPTIFCEIPVGGGPDSPLCAWLARTVRSVLPQLEEIGAATAAEVDK